MSIGPAFGNGYNGHYGYGPVGSSNNDENPEDKVDSAVKGRVPTPHVTASGLYDPELQQKDPDLFDDVDDLVRKAYARCAK